MTINLQHLETNLHRLSSPENILIFVKSNSKLHFFGLLSRPVRTLIINISSSEVPTNTMDIHSVRNVCKLVIIFQPSWQDLSHNVDHPFKNRLQRVQKQQMAPNSNNSPHLAHAHTKCPSALYYKLYYYMALSMVAYRYHSKFAKDFTKKRFDWRNFFIKNVKQKIINT